MVESIYILDTGAAYEEQSRNLLDQLKATGVQADIRRETDGATCKEGSGVKR